MGKFTIIEPNVKKFLLIIQIIIFLKKNDKIEVYRTKKRDAKISMIFRHPGCLRETLWAFRPTLADGLVLSLSQATIQVSMKKLMVHRLAN